MIAGYMTDEQRSQTGWIDVQKWERLLARALSFRKPANEIRLFIHSSRHPFIL